MTTIDKTRLSDLEELLGRHLPAPEPAAEPLNLKVPEPQGVGELVEGLESNEKDRIINFVNTYFEHFQANSGVILNRVVEDHPMAYIKGLVQIAQASLSKGFQVNIQNNVTTLAGKLYELRNNRNKGQ